MRLANSDKSLCTLLLLLALLFLVLLGDVAVNASVGRCMSMSWWRSVTPMVRFEESDEIFDDRKIVGNPLQCRNIDPVGALTPAPEAGPAVGLKDLMAAAACNCPRLRRVLREPLSPPLRAPE